MRFQMEKLWRQIDASRGVWDETPAKALASLLLDAIIFTRHMGATAAKERHDYLEKTYGGSLPIRLGHEDPIRLGGLEADPPSQANGLTIRLTTPTGTVAINKHDWPQFVEFITGVDIIIG